MYMYIFYTILVIYSDFIEIVVYVGFEAMTIICEYNINSQENMYILHTNAVATISELLSAIFLFYIFIATDFHKVIYILEFL